MLMFQNGLLGTFTPEIFMVIDFILCLLTPDFHPQNSSIEKAPVIILAVNFEHQQSFLYQLSTFDFQIATAEVHDIKFSLPGLIKKLIIISNISLFSTSDGLSYVDFSRPPTLLIS